MSDSNAGRDDSHETREPEDSGTITPGQSEVVDEPADEQERRELISREVRSAYMEYSGPIPHPLILRQMDEVVPGSAKQIIDDAHKQTAHRQELEGKYLDAGITNSKRGQVFGFIIAMTVIVGSLLLIAFDKDVVGFVLALTSLAALVGVFIYSQQREGRELRERRAAFPEETSNPPEQQTEVEGGS